MSKTNSLHYELCVEGAKWLRKQKWNYDRCQKKSCYRTEACGQCKKYRYVAVELCTWDCEGLEAEPVVTPNVGILSSTDILAIDQACVDIIYAMTPEDRHAMVERIETRHGHRQLSYMKELGMGNNRYILIDLDNGGKRITAADAVVGLKPFILG